MQRSALFSSMTHSASLAAIAWTVFAGGALAASESAVVPNPASMVREAGAFPLSAATPIVVTDASEASGQVAASLADLLRRVNGMTLRVRPGAARDGAIVLAIDPGAGLGPEAYRLEVRSRRITIHASTPEGLFHGGTTLLQLIDPGKRSRAAIAAITVDDAPRFPWRGIMLDSARHFQSPEFIRRFIDAMALHKLNVLHWHLTDDQAWRLEIRKYPALTQTGAWRVPAGAAREDIDRATGKPRLYGGYYSQETVRGLVAYAAARAITIVPEIEMPGHATAAIAAYPALAAGDSPAREVPADWGIYSNALNFDEDTFKFLEDVLTEVMEMFPGKFIHKGGDEVKRDQWTNSPRVQARMRELGISDPEGLEAYFTQRIARFLEAHGRRLVGWDEILEPHLAASAVVMSWRGIDGALTAAARGYDTVLAPDPYLYFDNRQGWSPDEPPGRLRVLASLESVYAFEPMPGALAANERKHVLGLQGSVWTEHIRTEERVGYMTFPRAAALAELGWSLPERRDWQGFLQRLAAGLSRYDALGIRYSDSAFTVHARISYPSAAGDAEIDLSTQAGYGAIRYTLDGSDPSPRSPRYEKTVRVAAPAQMRAATFDGERRLSRPRRIAIARDGEMRRSSHEMNLCGNDIALAIEDDAPLAGPRAVFAVDIQNPCWILDDVDLGGARSLVARVGQVPFNFQIGEDVNKIVFETPATPAGELVVHLDDCEGEILARLALAPAAASHAVTRLPAARIEARGGKRDLCLRFAQRGVDPMWVIDSVELAGARP
jgi:hexosaminidase